MLRSERMPIVFLACVNSYQGKRRIRPYVHERKHLARILQPKGTFHRYKAIEKGNRSNKYFLDLLDTYGLHRQIEILHFVGQPQAGRLAFESEDFETSVLMPELSRFIDRLPNLKVVFLSGCATKDWVEFFLKKDVPAVMATHSEGPSDTSAHIASKFYQALHRGSSIKEACNMLIRTYRNFAFHPTQYDVIEDRCTWNYEESDNDVLPWGVYGFEENMEKIKQRPPKRPVIPFPIDHKYFTAQYKKRLRTGSRLAFFALVVGIIAVSIALSIKQAPEISMVLASWTH
ncbi:MAG: hypothetical protein AAF135_26735 [Bacteroidota bacterium]